MTIYLQRPAALTIWCEGDGEQNVRHSTSKKENTILYLGQITISPILVHAIKCGVDRKRSKNRNCKRHQFILQWVFNAIITNDISPHVRNILSDLIPIYSQPYAPFYLLSYTIVFSIPIPGRGWLEIGFLCGFQTTTLRLITYVQIKETCVWEILRANEY